MYPEALKDLILKYAVAAKFRIDNTSGDIRADYLKLYDEIENMMIDSCYDLEFIDILPFLPAPLVEAYQDFINGL